MINKTLSYRVKLLVPTSEISTNACYMLRGLMAVLGDNEHDQLTELTVWMKLTVEQARKLKIQSAEVLSELQKVHGVTIKRVISVV